MSAAAVIRPLDKDELAAYIDGFVSVAADVPGEYWSAENFLREFPEKWTLSLAAWNADTPLGYAILSRRFPETAHLHHFMVAQAARGIGLGGCLLAGAMARCRTHGCREMTLKVAVGSLDAQRFYRRHGFGDVGSEVGHRLMRRRLD